MGTLVQIGRLDVTPRRSPDVSFKLSECIAWWQQLQHRALVAHLRLPEGSGVPTA
jgi:hypothetical protein